MEEDKALKLYHDENCLFEMVNIKFHEPTRAGEVGEEEGFVKNTSSDELRNIMIKAESPEVSVQLVPITLQAGEERKVIFTWSPPKDKKKALKTPVNLSWDRIILVEE